MSHGLLRASNGAGTGTLSTSSGLLVASNPNRRSIILCNDDAAIVVYLGFGVPAVLNSGLRLGPGQVSPPILDWAGDIFALSVSGTPKVTFVEV